MNVTATDNRDGTANISIVNGDAAAVVSIQGSKISFADPNTVWAEVASLTLDGSGAGSVNATLAEGVWVFVFVVDGVFDSAAVRLDMAKDGGAPATRVREAVISRILTLALPIRSVVAQWNNEDLSNVEFPAVICSPGEGLGEQYENGMNLTDDIAHPVMVELFDRCDVYDHSNLPDWDEWRKAMMRAFHNRPLDAVFENVICRVEPGPIVDHDIPKFQFLMGRFVIRVVNREHRTT